MDRTTRREYLAIGGIAVVAGLAGCDSSGTSEPTDGGGEPNETTRSTTTTKTDDPEDLREVTVDENWRYPRFDAQNTGATDNAGPTGDLEVRWEANLDGAIDGATPTLANGKLFIGTKAKVAYALDAATGTELWSTKFGHSILDPAPVVDGSVYFTSDRIHSLDADTGEEEWVYSITAGNRGVPLVADGRVFCLSDPGELHVLDAESGDRLWKRPLGNVQDFLAYDDGVLYASFPEKTVAVDTESKEQLWSTSIPGNTNSGPAIRGSNAFIEGDYVYKINIDNGSKTKINNLPGPDSVSVSDNFIACPSFSDENGYKIRSYQRDSKRNNSVRFREGPKLILADGKVYSTLNGGGLRIYSTDDLELLSRYDNLSNDYTHPVVSSELSFLVNEGRIVCIQDEGQ